MLALLGLILILVTILSSFIFVTQRSIRFQNHQAAGQRLAAFALSSHAFAQRYYYVDLDQAPMEGTILFDSENPHGFLMPANAGIWRSVGGLRYHVTVHGWGASPITSDGVIPSTRAASAYMHIRVFADGSGGMTRFLPSDEVAFLAGAAARGLTRLGTVIGTPGSRSPTEICDGAPLAVKWGPEESACLNDTHLVDLGIIDAIAGDYIIPTWEVALNTDAHHAMFRYPQPQRPELNSMTTNLAMNGAPTDDDWQITNITTTTTRNMNASGLTETDRLNMRSGHSALIAEAVTDNTLNILSPDATQPALNVMGETIFTPGTNVNVANTIHADDPARPVAVDIANPVDTELITGMDILLEVKPYNAGDTLLLAAQNVVSPFGSLSVLSQPGESSYLALTGRLNANMGSGTLIRAATGADPLQIYAGDLVTTGTSHIVFSNPSGSTIPFNVGAVEQDSAPYPGTSFLRIPNVEIVLDCHGIGCPDYQTDEPGGGL